jgi:hypothetical protein
VIRAIPAEYSITFRSANGGCPGRADEVIESVKWVAHAAAKATEAAAPEATETATAASRLIAGVPTLGYKANAHTRLFARLGEDVLRFLE